MVRCAGRLGCALVLGLVIATAAETVSAGSITAEAIYRATGVQGGLVVHLGCGDGKLTASLRANDRYRVHGLDTDAEDIARARELLHTKGLCGPASVMRFDGKQLPYVGNTVNLLVAEDLGRIAMAEVDRVLAPEGVAYIRRGGTWRKTVKPRPEDIDEWTHFLHDSGGNAVAEDEQIHPPTSLRWAAGPRWCRSHEIPSSVNAVVTAGGRIFTIFDEGPTGVYEKLPQKCMLVARDAFNGVLLWKVPMRKWDTKLGTGKGNRWGIHHTIPRRLVAEGDRVYVTLQFLNSPVSVLDAATGRTLTEFKGTAGADELILSGGVLFATITQKRSPSAGMRVGTKTLDNTLVAIDVATGRQLWRKEDARVAPYTLAAKDGRVVYHDLSELICLDAKTGRDRWRTKNAVGQIPSAMSSLVVKDGVVLYHGQKQSTQPAAGSGKGRKRRGRPGQYLTAFSLDDGKTLWDCRGSGPISAACTQPTEVFVAKGVVWCGLSTKGYDLRTGEVKKQVNLHKLISAGHHRRCLRGKATVNYVIRNKRGAEFIDLNGDNHMRHDWPRTPCFTGATLANGIFYKPPDQCFCYPGVKIVGYLAMASDRVEKLKPSTTAALRKGDAYGKVAGARAPSDEDWPMHRRDGQRSGWTKTAVPAGLGKKWEVELSCQATQPVIVGRRLWVAEKDIHTIRCLDAGTGKDVWSFIAGGRVDSAPTVHDGMVIFGCRDGSVYCLRATDGVLVWRFRAAPDERRIVSFEQVESLWPVHGSVLVQDGTVYFAAGRSSFLDGGIIVYGLDAKSGKVLHHHVLEGPRPDIKKDVGRPFAMEGALPDILVSGKSKNLYMMRIKFDPELNRLQTKRESSLGELAMGESHLVATGGFLDDSGYDRIFWMHSQRWPGFYLAQHSPKSGQLVVFDDSTTYAVKYFYRRHQWSPKFFPQDKGYLLFADDIDNEPGFIERGKKTIEWLPQETRRDSHRRGGRGVEKGTGYVRHKPEKYQKMIPVRVRAMVLAGDRLFVAGPPDKVVAGDPLAAFEGRAGALLQVFSAKDGSLVKSRELSSPPAFDGMSAAGGRLYLATRDGKVICF